jgi:hypothetical protein
MLVNAAVDEVAAAVGDSTAMGTEMGGAEDEVDAGVEVAGVARGGVKTRVTRVQRMLLPRNEG